MFKVMTTKYFKNGTACFESRSFVSREDATIYAEQVQAETGQLVSRVDVDVIECQQALPGTGG